MIPDTENDLSTYALFVINSHFKAVVTRASRLQRKRCILPLRTPNTLSYLWAGLTGWVHQHRSVWPYCYKLQPGPGVQQMSTYVQWSVTAPVNHSDPWACKRSSAFSPGFAVAEVNQLPNAANTSVTFAN